MPYGTNLKPIFALVECDGDSVIAQINDVGPLRLGRIIDLNRRTMHYFGPTLRLGLIDGVNVTPSPATTGKPDRHRRRRTHHARRRFCPVAALRAPDFPGQFNDHPELGPLLLFGQSVALLG